MPISVSTVLDNREKDELRNVFIAHQEELPFTLESLALGDVEFRNSVDNIPVFRLERKTLADLAASVNGDRWRNQKVRLLASRSECPCGYIIEGSLEGAPDFLGQGVPKDTLLSALVNTLVRDGLPFICTESPEQTWVWVRSISKKIAEHGGCAGLGQPLDKAAGVNSYLDTVQTVKARNITPSNALACMLIQIPSVSSSIAEAVGRQYSSVASLVEAFSKAEHNPENLLEDIVIKEAGAGVRARRVGPSASKKIWSHLMGK